MATPQNPFLDIEKFFEQFRTQGVDVDTVVQSQRKNIEALVAANRAIAESVQTIAQREQELFQEALVEWQKAAAEIASEGDLQGRTAKQAALMTEALEQAIKNMRELAELVAKAQQETMAIVNKRVDESLDEIRSQLPSTGKRARKQGR